MSERGDFTGGLIFGTIIVSILCFFVIEGTDDSWRRQIVEHHGAEWYLDEKHERQWRWLK